MPTDVNEGTTIQYVQGANRLTNMKLDKLERLIGQFAGKIDLIVALGDKIEGQTRELKELTKVFKAWAKTQANSTT